MRQPLYRMAAHPTIAFANVGPFGIFPQAEKNTWGTLVAACCQHHFIAFMKFSHRVSLSLGSKLRFVDQSGLFQPDALRIVLFSRQCGLTLRRLFLVETGGLQLFGGVSGLFPTA